jgi:hypothetical protein
MLLVAGAFLLHAALIVWRNACFQTSPRLTERPYLALFAACLAADLIAACGFYLLLQSQPSPSRLHNQVLTGLALFAGAAIVWKFALSPKGGATRRRIVATLASTLLRFASYLLFGFIAYYSKILQSGERLGLSDGWIPILMLSLLWVNTIYDHWDHAEGGE